MLVNSVLNLINFDHVNCLLVALRLLVALSPLFLEDDHLVSLTDLLDSGIHLGFRNCRSSDSGVVSSANEHYIVNADLRAYLNVASQNFSHHSIILHHFMLDALHSDDSKDARGIDWQSHTLLWVMDH